MSIRNCVAGCQQYGNVHLFLAPLSAESTLDGLGADGHAPPAMGPSNATPISAPGRHQMLQKTHKRPKLACATVCLFVAAKPSCSACGHSPLRPHLMHPATGAKGRYGVAALANGDACPSHRTRFPHAIGGLEAEFLQYGEVDINTAEKSGAPVDSLFFQACQLCVHVPEGRFQVFVAHPLEPFQSPGSSLPANRRHSKNKARVSLSPIHARNSTVSAHGTNFWYQELINEFFGRQGSWDRSAACSSCFLHGSPSAASSLCRAPCKFGHSPFRAA